MSAPTLSVRRKILLSAVLVCLVLTVGLGGVEAVLRLAGYGYSPHFFRRARTSNGETVWRENRWVTAPFFSPALVRRPQPVRLPEHKAPHTFRIFVLGSSAAMGDPEPSFSIARTLELMLRDAFPDAHFEVVNAAITAVNSHVVRGIAADCAQLEPDVFIVYEGNNEVIGPFGPSGVFTPFLRSESAVRTVAWLKSLRLGQLLDAAGRSLRGESGAPAGWGGMQMFLKQQITDDDPRLASVAALFRANLVAIARSAQHAGANTLLCTVATNERDFAPFLSQHRRDLTSDARVRWEHEIATAEDAQRRNDFAAAEAAYRAALALDDQHAETAFRLGRLLLQTGRDAEAASLLRRARDLDTLRFRTDTRLNEAIRAAANSGAPDVELVDLAGALAARSPHGLCGDEFLYEHVHLTLRGTYEAARELFPHVVAALSTRGLAATKTDSIPDYATVRAQLAYSTYEQGLIAHELVNRFRGPPFDAQADHAFREQTWRQRAEAADALLSRADALPALRQIYADALAHSPDDWVLERNAGAMLVARGAPADALPLLERAHARIDDDIDTLLPLGWAYRQTGHTADANAVFRVARQLEPNYPGLPPASSTGPE